jgi:prepilin-type N-terminal cleavage/methylation domain-containing protein
MDNTAPKADRDAGFTLIELLVVMIIIGILAAIAIPTFLSQRQNAVGSGQIGDLRSVADVVEGFYVKNEEYPTSFVWSGDQVTIGSALGTGTQRVTVGNEIRYSLNSGSTAYCLQAINRKAAGDRFWVSDAGGIQPVSVNGCPF